MFDKCSSCNNNSRLIIILFNKRCEQQSQDFDSLQRRDESIMMVLMFETVDGSVLGIQ